MSDHADTIRLWQTIKYALPALGAHTVLIREQKPLKEAHEALDALLAENQRLRDALQQIIEGADDFFSNDRSNFDIDDTRDIARAALAAVRVEDA